MTRLRLVLSAGVLFWGLSGPAWAIPNPSSVYCLDQGGTSFLVKAAPQAGEQGLCQFADGAILEEWTFFRLQNGPSQAASVFEGATGAADSDAFCTDRGGAIETVASKENQNQTYRLCRFADHSLIEMRTLQGGPAKYPVLGAQLQSMRH